MEHTVVTSDISAEGSWPWTYPKGDAWGDVLKLLLFCMSIYYSVCWEWSVIGCLYFMLCVLFYWQASMAGLEEGL